MVSLMRMMGKRILAGISYEGPDGKFMGRLQMVGKVVRISDVALVIDREDGWGEVSLPADPELYKPAPTGTYRPNNGVDVVDPDYITTILLKMVDPMPGTDDLHPKDGQ